MMSNTAKSTTRTETSSSQPTNSAVTKTDSNSFRLVAIGIGVLLLLAVGYFISGGFVDANADPEAQGVTDGDSVRRLPVRVATAEFVDSISQRRSYTGTLRAKQQATLGFELTGRVQEVLCDEGDYVEAGQRLAVLDQKALDARRGAMAASLAQATAVLAELKAGPRQQTIDSMQAQLDEADSNMKLAALTLQRRKRLRGTNAISKTEFDQALYSHRAAESKFEAISQQLQELQAGTRVEKVNAQAAAVQQLQSSVDEIDVQIEKSTLVAPFSGKIVSRMIDPGSVTTASASILKIVDTGNLEALVGVPLETARKLKVDTVYTLFVEGVSYQATLLAKIQELDVATRTQNLIFQLIQDDQNYALPGQLCQIEIETDVGGAGYWVPAAALSNGIRGLWSLLVVDADTSRVVRCDVEIVYTDGERVLVRGTVENGAQVIVDGTHRIVEGQYVEAILAEADQR